MKKLSLINITAIMMIGIYLYSIASQLSYLTGDYRYAIILTPDFHTMYGLMIMILSACGFIAGTGLYFYRNWSRSLAVFISTFFLVQSLQGLMVLAFSDRHFIKTTVELVVYLLLAAWCLYYLNRPDVVKEFEKDVPGNENSIIKTGDRMTKYSRGIRIAAILLTLIYGFQIIIFSSSIPRMRNLSLSADAVIIIGCYLILIPFWGFVSGISLFFIKNMVRKNTVVFSMVAICFYLQSLFICNDQLIRFMSVLFLPLPAWALYYFTRPRIKFLFAAK
jgi:hypothetical protein